MAGSLAPACPSSPSRQRLARLGWLFGSEWKNCDFSRRLLISSPQADASNPSSHSDWVLRWSALGLGIFYGFTHQRAITASQKAEHAQHEYEKKEKLIQQAKAEFSKKKNPTSGDSVITDPSDPKFDLEKLLLKVQKESP
ncbi:Ff.00g093070.m01.CDS01 [Fusarium sp. VM40]|nr:Ff.00g093070.m01.CDS01 [Fusarium sp. VM40]